MVGNILAPDLRSLVRAAWDNLLGSLEGSHLTLVSEGDLQANLFHNIKILSEQLPNPFEIHAEDEWADLTIGRQRVHVELKFSKSGSGGYKTQRREIVADLEKLAHPGASVAYLGIISQVPYWFDRHSAQFIDLYAQGYDGPVRRLRTEPLLTCCLLERLDNISHFAYASNLQKKQMVERVGMWKDSYRAVADNFRLTFDSRGKADIVEKGGGRVHGAVYLLSRTQMRKLDAHEGVREGVYRRSTVEVRTDSHSLSAVAYVRTEVTTPASPDSGYLEKIAEGLADHGYDDSVISEVRAIAESPS
jgi:hypothetical protein